MRFQRESDTTKSCFLLESAAAVAMCPTRRTPTPDVTNKYGDALQQSDTDDAAKSQMTSTRRYVDSVEHLSVSTDHLHHPQPQQQQQQQQPQQPTSTQYISDTCVLLTYFNGDVESNVNEHFSRALSRRSSFGPNCNDITQPSVHSGM